MEVHEQACRERRGAARGAALMSGLGLLQRVRRSSARSLDLSRLPALQVRLCGLALPPPPDTWLLR